MTVRGVILLGWVLGGAVLAHPMAASQQRPTFTASARLVTVAVSVTERRTGEPVRGLGPEDFRISSDGIDRPIVQFNGNSGPVTLAVLLDASGSMAVNRVFGPATQAARRLLGTLAPGDDRAAVFTFDREVVERQPFAWVAPTHPRALDHLDAYGSTSLYDAALLVSRAAAQDAHPRRGVVVYTDGTDTSSAARPWHVRELAAALDVPLYLVAMAGARHDAMSSLQSLAEQTGGRLLPVSDDVSVDRAHEDILTSVRRHYLLAFEPDLRPGWHALTVHTRAAHVVRARAGYFVSPRS